MYETIGTDPLTVVWGRNYLRTIQVNQIDKVTWCGTVIRNKKLIGRWIWSRNRFQNPVLISTIKKVNGKPKRFTKLPICEAIKKIVLAEIKRQKEEGNANKTTS